MDTWRTHMPDGMLMKSEPYASTIASPDGKYTVAAYCESRGLEYVDRVGPLTRERFLDYADWYTEQTGARVSGTRRDRGDPGRRRLPGHVRERGAGYSPGR